MGRRVRSTATDAAPPAELQAQVRDWLDEAQAPALEKLWGLSGGA